MRKVPSKKCTVASTVALLMGEGISTHYNSYSWSASCKDSRLKDGSRDSQGLKAHLN